MNLITIIDSVASRGVQRSSIPSLRNLKAGSRASRLLGEIGSSLSPKSSALLKQLAEDSENPRLLDLRLSPASDLFTAQEITFLDELDKECGERPGTLKARTILILKATRLCNLRCTYCNSWRDGPGQVMELDVLARIIRDALLAPGVKALDIVWHGGEVTLLKPAFIERALWIQERYREPGVEVSHAIQTNATRLNPEWVQFFKYHDFSVGVSVDGPPEVHDSRRVNKAGQGSWKNVKRGIDLLRNAGVPFGVLAVLDVCVISMGARNYLDYLAKLDVPAVALLNVLPPNDPLSENRTSYLNWARYQEFMRDLFRIWWSDYRAAFSIRELQSLVDAVTKGSTGLCLYAHNCMGQYLTVEPDGRVSACDKYVGDPALTFGSLQEANLSELLYNSRNLREAVRNVDIQKASTDRCDYYKYCNGGCPHDARINHEHQPGFDMGCCGLRPLLDDIIAAVSQNPT